MKKTFLFISLLLIITGCNDSNKSKNNEKSLLDDIVLEDKDAAYECSMYNKNNKDYDIAGKYAIFLDDKDNVIMVNSTEVVESKKNEILNQFENYYNSSYDKIANYGGYTYDIYQENNRVIANVIIDYNTFNMESYATEHEEIVPYINEEHHLTKDKLIEKYNSQNIKCEKKQK